MDMGWQNLANEARRAEFAIIISYPTSVSGIIVSTCIASVWLTRMLKLSK